jgi:hypothetical protein
MSTLSSQRSAAHRRRCVDATRNSNHESRCKQSLRGVLTYFLCTIVFTFSIKHLFLPSQSSYMRRHPCVVDRARGYLGRWPTLQPAIVFSCTLIGTSSYAPLCQPPYPHTRRPGTRSSALLGFHRSIVHWPAYVFLRGTRSVKQHYVWAPMRG